VCGFAGEIRRRGAADVDALHRMSDVLEPRGPDGVGMWSHEGVGFVHRRLKILDLSERSAQPMHDPITGLTVVFNGLIYNHRDLRSELEARGHRFFSGGDTEVVLRAFAEWGPRCVERFLGMFAFAIHERDGGRLTLARDRLGIKPLYLADVPHALRFASTLPALLRGGGVDTSLDPVALHHYLSWHSVVPAPRTVLNGVRKLPAATYLVIEPDGRRHSTEYWQPRFERHEERAGWSEEEWQEAVLDALRTAVERRTVADVPVGVLLSGGLDSSLIVGLLAEAGHSAIKTFSIGFCARDGRSGDEFGYSDLIADEFATVHRRIEIGDERMLGALQAAIRSMSEPMVSHDCVAFHLLGEEVSRDVKVVQSGQGADEVFAGYSWYQPLAGVDGLGLDEYAAEFFDRSGDDAASLLGPRHRVPGDPSLAFAREHFTRAGAATPVDRALRLDTQIMLTDDPVKRVDNMTMAWGLECRTPFLDHELVELAAACPPAYKLAHGGKGVLKQAARSVVPDAVIDRPKGYFPVPALRHLEGEYLQLVRDALASPAARSRAIFDDRALIDLLAAPNDHRTRLEGNTLWQVGTLELWLQAHGL
jgi:asparagine synthase (glutamine-hydrolysing)